MLRKPKLQQKHHKQKHQQKLLRQNQILQLTEIFILFIDFDEKSNNFFHF